jgi:hypothetical protein
VKVTHDLIPFGKKLISRIHGICFHFIHLIHQSILFCLFARIRVASLCFILPFSRWFHFICLSLLGLALLSFRSFHLIWFIGICSIFDFDAPLDQIHHFIHQDSNISQRLCEQWNNWIILRIEFTFLKWSFDQMWNFEMLKSWDLEIMIYWNIEIVKLGNG